MSSHFRKVSIRYPSARVPGNNNNNGYANRVNARDRQNERERETPSERDGAQARPRDRAHKRAVFGARGSEEKEGWRVSERELDSEGGIQGRGEGGPKGQRE